MTFKIQTKQTTTPPEIYMYSSFFLEFPEKNNVKHVSAHGLRYSIHRAVPLLAYIKPIWDDSRLSGGQAHPQNVGVLCLKGALFMYGAKTKKRKQIEHTFLLPTEIL